MKRYVVASELSGSDLIEYINKLMKNVEHDLPEAVSHVKWDMEDENVILDVYFHGADFHTFVFEIWRFTQNMFYISSDVDMIINSIKNYIRNTGIDTFLDEDSSDWEFVDRKSVQDYDGFYTDYTLWYNPEEDRWVCIFGDSDLYTPDNSSYDAEFETEREAYEWFDSYGEDDIVEESHRIRASNTSEEFMDMGTGLNYWYFTTHGVQPGSVPKGLNILKILDRPEGTYFLTDTVLTTKSLKYYDIKERSPRDAI